MEFFTIYKSSFCLFDFHIIRLYLILYRTYIHIIHNLFNNFVDNNNSIFLLCFLFNCYLENGHKIYFFDLCTIQLTVAKMLLYVIIFIYLIFNIRSFLYVYIWYLIWIVLIFIYLKFNIRSFLYFYIWYLILDRSYIYTFAIW